MSWPDSFFKECPYCKEYEDLPEHIKEGRVGGLEVGKVFCTSIDYDDNGYHIELPTGNDIGIRYCPYCGENLYLRWIKMKYKGGE